MKAWRVKGRQTKQPMVRILPTPSPLFYLLMMHAGLMPRLKAQDHGPALQLNGLPAN